MSEPSQHDHGRAIDRPAEGAYLRAVADFDGLPREVAEEIARLRTENVSLREAAADAVRMARLLKAKLEPVARHTGTDMPSSVLMDARAVIDRWSVAEPRTKTCSSTEGIR